MLIGYARVSTADQDLALQTDALTKAGCEKLFTDKASGAKADRPGLAEALHFARAGDCIVVWKLDRLGRSIQGLISLAADLSARKVDFRSLTDGFDTSTGLGPAPLPYPRLGGRDGARADQGADCRRLGGGSEEGRDRQRPKIGADARQAGHSTQAARSGGQAGQAAASRPFDLLPPFPGR